MANRGSAARRARQLIGASLVLVSSLLLLAGCSAPDRISAKLDRGALSFVSCDAYTANRILLEAAVLKSKSFDYKTMWKASGSGKFGPNIPVELGVPPTGFHTR